MALAHTLGLARDPQLEQIQTAWRLGTLDAATRDACVRQRRAQRWQAQREAGITLLAVGDGSGIDRVLRHSLTFGVVPSPRQTHLDVQPQVGEDGETVAAATLAQWPDSPARPCAPSPHADRVHTLDDAWLLEEIEQARALGHAVKPVLLGPLTYLWQSATADQAVDPLEGLERLLPLYDLLFNRLAEQGVEWVQIDEPILALALPQAWKNAYERVYNILQRAPLKKLVATYFGPLADNLGLAAHLPVDGLHIDLACAPEQYPLMLDRLPAYKVLSLGVVHGSDAQPCDERQALALLHDAAERLGERLWVAPSCPLSGDDTSYPGDSASDLALAVRKCREVAALVRALNATVRTADDRAAA